MNYFFHRVLLISILVLVLEQALTSQSAAEPVNKLLQKNPELQVPARLRPRVNFWIDIFGRYTKAQVVIHHRRFPQIRFGVLNIEQQTAGMNDVAFDSYKDRALKAILKEVREDIAFLAAGEAPKTQQQRSIELAMRTLGPGLDKYKRIVDDPELVRGQSGIREKMGAAIQRAGRYLPIIEEIFVDEFQLPVEITRLPFVESSFDYKAYSSVAAAGIWQFMPKTAKSYMRVSATIDERLDPVESSRAAAKYLRSAYSRLGTWPLALTSYNHGVAGVLNKVRKFGTADISSLIESASEPPPFGFASGNFFPSYLAAKEIFERRAEFFPGLVPEPPLQLTMLRLSRAVMVSELNKKIGISEEELRNSNYAFSEKIWRGQSAIPAGYNLKVPEYFEARLVQAGFGESVENFSVDSTARIEPLVVALANNVKQELGSGDTGIGRPLQDNEKEMIRDVPIQPSTQALKENSYKVKPGDTLYSISRDFGVSVPAIKLENKIKGSAVFVGKMLVIPQDKSEMEPVKAQSKPSKGGLLKLYTVKKGDSPGSVAKRMGIPLSKLIAKNGLSAKKPTIKIGQVLKIPLG